MPLITKQDLLNYGFRIERSVNENTIDLAIEEAEGVIRATIGGERYRELLKIDPSDPFVRGGEMGDTYVAGMSKAAAYIAHAHLLSYDYVTTGFGNVQKKDDNSQQIDAYTRAKKSYGIGRRYLIETLDAKGWKHELVNTIWEEAAL